LISDTNSVSTTFQVTVNNGLENSSFDDNFLFIFPNPFSEQAVIQSRTYLNDATIKLINTYGKEVKQLNNINGQSIIFCRDDLSSGVYFLMLHQKNQPMTIKKITIID